MKCPKACSFSFCNEQEIFWNKSRINDRKTAGDAETEINSTYLTLTNRRGGGVGCRTAPGGKGHLDLENLGPGLCDQFSCSSRRAWERHPHELGITEVMATGNSRSLKCGHFLRRCLSHYCIEGQVTARLPCSCYEKTTVWRVHIYYKPGCQLVSITLMQLIFKKLSLLLNSYKIL